jgi:hypothetical protein
MHNDIDWSKVTIGASGMWPPAPPGYIHQPTHYHECRLEVRDGHIVAVCKSCGETYDQDEIENEMNRSLSDY